METKWICSVILGLMLPFSMGSSTPYREIIPTLQLPEIVVTAKKLQKRNKARQTEYFGFKLRGIVNTKVSEQLQEVLATYTGPSVGINSLRRYWNRSSKHYHGNAVDLEFSHELIEWLISEEGTSWRTQHNLKFYIEGKPRSKRITPYEQDNRFSPYVFRNPNATGDHIHIEIET